MSAKACRRNHKNDSSEIDFLKSQVNRLIKAEEEAKAIDAAVSGKGQEGISSLLPGALGATIAFHMKQAGSAQEGAAGGAQVEPLRSVNLDDETPASASQGLTPATTPRVAVIEPEEDTHAPRQTKTNRKSVTWQSINQNELNDDLLSHLSKCANAVKALSDSLEEATKLWQSQQEYERYCIAPAFRRAQTSFKRLREFEADFEPPSKKQRAAVAISHPKDSTASAGDRKESEVSSSANLNSKSARLSSGERIMLRNFERHAENCRKCRLVYNAYSSGKTICSKGRPLAEEVLRCVRYAGGGAFVLLQQSEPRVHMPTDCPLTADLLRADAHFGKPEETPARARRGGGGGRFYQVDEERLDDDMEVLDVLARRRERSKQSSGASAHDLAGGRAAQRKPKERTYEYDDIIDLAVPIEEKWKKDDTGKGEFRSDRTDGRKRSDDSANRYVALDYPLSLGFRPHDLPPQDHQHVSRRSRSPQRRSNSSSLSSDRRRTTTSSDPIPQRDRVVRQERISRGAPRDASPSRIRETVIIDEARPERRVAGDDVVEIIEEHSDVTTTTPPPPRKISCSAACPTPRVLRGQPPPPQGFSPPAPSAQQNSGYPVQSRPAFPQAVRSPQSGYPANYMPPPPQSQMQQAPPNPVSPLARTRTSSPAPVPLINVFNDAANVEDYDSDGDGSINYNSRRRSSEPSGPMRRSSQRGRSDIPSRPRMRARTTTTTTTISKGSPPQKFPASPSLPEYQPFDLNPVLESMAFGGVQTNSSTVPRVHTEEWGTPPPQKTSVVGGREDFSAVDELLRSWTLLPDV